MSCATSSSSSSLEPITEFFTALVTTNSLCYIVCLTVPWTTGQRQQTQLPLVKQLGFPSLAYRAGISLSWTKAAPGCFIPAHREQVQPGLTTCDRRWMMIWRMSHNDLKNVQPGMLIFSPTSTIRAPSTEIRAIFPFLQYVEARTSCSWLCSGGLPDSCRTTKPGKWSCEKSFLPFLQQRTSTRGKQSNNI